MKRTLLAVPLALACSAALCSPHRYALVVTEPELAAIGAEDRPGLEAKATALRDAEQDHAAQKLALAAAEREAQIAGLMVSRDRTTAEIAELEFQAAQETKDADTMLPAKQARAAAATQLQRSLATQRRSQAQRDLVIQLVAVREAEIPVARAILELARYEAAAKARGGPEGERLAGFRLQVATFEAELAEAHLLAARAKAVVDALPGALPGEGLADGSVAPAASAP